MQTSPILVIGATGKTGSRVANLLDAAGHSVRRASRGSDTPFDWEEPGTWAPALGGVSAAYITYYPDMAFPGAADRIQALTEMAAQAGVGRLVLLAGRGEPRAEACEDIVRRSGIDYTLVRAAWFAQNFSEGFLFDAAMDGMIALPAGDVAEPFVDIDDVAEVVAAALTGDGHAGQVYDVTGPQLLTFHAAAAMLGAAMGREVGYAPIGFDMFHEALTGLEGPEVADVFTEVCRQIFDGRNARLGDGVQRALGRPARDFASYCTKAAAAGAWAKAA
ncbi:SDR family oxidoreductase [Aestuariicoccus sp. MJ-SS9]|uniref:SDR family oxidoreductase n=1 Tax=Aestuariicoccus sp. MJ-SS9 TaxID=3079855 RepID=UPI00290CE154|nr:NmrA family NAD(P)-binding protein [Aestuariicoccus sp. MJ-SS9]MDU8913152.1 NAD(P)H-binding protein [Aestuariicoccus sp. MJ-SS9]